MTYSLTLSDDTNELALRLCDVDVTITYVVDPGDPGCWRTRNGDGWPATPPCVELDGFTIDRVSSACGLPVPVTDAVLANIRVWVDRQLEQRWDAIERDVLSQDDYECGEGY